MSEHTETRTYTKQVTVTETIEVPKVGSRWKYKDGFDDTVRTITAVGAIDPEHPGSTKVYGDDGYEGELDYFVYMPGCGAVLYEPAPEPKWYETMTREQLVAAMAELEAAECTSDLYRALYHLRDDYKPAVAV